METPHGSHLAPNFCREKVFNFWAPTFFWGNFWNSCRMVGIFPYKPAILGDPQLWKPPNSCFFLGTAQVLVMCIFGLLMSQSISQVALLPPGALRGATTTVSWIWGILCVGYYETIPQFLFCHFLAVNYSGTALPKVMLIEECSI